MDSRKPPRVQALLPAQECIAIGRMLQAQPTAAALDAFAQVLPAFAGKLVVLPVSGSQTPTSGNRDGFSFAREAIEQDYLRLFVGLGTPLAPPWESAWASDARLLFQRETLDVRYWYRSQGLQPKHLHHEPDDHIGLELEFVGRLLEAGLGEEAAHFAAEHPCAWVGRWSAAVAVSAQHAFYPALARRACELLESYAR